MFCLFCSLKRCAEFRESMFVCFVPVQSLNSRLPDLDARTEVISGAILFVISIFGNDVTRADLVPTSLRPKVKCFSLP